jgi:hypothetical protein
MAMQPRHVLDVPRFFTGRLAQYCDEGHNWPEIRRRLIADLSSLPATLAAPGAKPIQPGYDNMERQVAWRDDWGF